MVKLCVRLGTSCRLQLQEADLHANSGLSGLWDAAGPHPGLPL
jgi:hypothetical protein